MLKEKKKVSEIHEPVLLNEVLEAFNLAKDARLNKVKIIDATAGLGGHTEALIKSGADVLGIEADSEMLKLARERLMIACPTPKDKTWGSYKLVHGNFRNIDEIAGKESFEDVSGILFDLGVSSPQITSGARGISFQHDEAYLDMRLDKVGQSVTGADLLNVLRSDQLEMLFARVLTQGEAKNLAEGILKERSFKKIETVGDFKKVIERNFKRKSWLNVATLPFLALRIAVNSEIENISDALPKALKILKGGGRIAVISFHSVEDSVVKSVFKNWESELLGRVITQKPIVPNPDETVRNVRARSAKMRIFQKK